MITFENVSKKYDDTTVVDQLNFTIKDQEIFVLVGPSGSGKTTTLKMINNLIPLSEGDISIDNKSFQDYDLYELRWNIGYVLQQIALFPNMTVEENISIVPDMKKWDKTKTKDRVTKLLETVRLDPDTYRNREVSELSGGQQQRIGVARALAANPDILLMDEPFSALDPISRYGLQEDLLDLQNQLNKTIVFVTHDMQEAIKMGDRICIMNKGKVEQIGTPNEILKNPSSDFVKKFIKTGLPDYQDKKSEQSIKDFINSGLLTPIAADLDHSLTTEDSINDLLEELIANNLAIVKDGRSIYEVTPEDYLKYLKYSSHEEVEQA